jgi:hypothetical protein
MKTRFMAGPIVSHQLSYFFAGSKSQTRRSWRDVDDA